MFDLNRLATDLILFSLPEMGSSPAGDSAPEFADAAEEKPGCA
jgi:hypothetical protein